MMLKTKDDFLRCVRNELVSLNPKVKNLGIKGYLEYSSIPNVIHPDSIFLYYDKDLERYVGKSMLLKIYRDLYQIDPFEGAVGNELRYNSSDTIFNTWSFIKRYAKAKTNNKYASRKDVYEHYDEIFDENDEVVKLLNKLSDYYHSIANFMPAFEGLNGIKLNSGVKGCYSEDNDMPDLYYKKIKNDLRFENRVKWINVNMDKLCLQFFVDYNSTFKLGDTSEIFDINDEEQLNNFKENIEKAIKCIEERAERLLKLSEKNIKTIS